MARLENGSKIFGSKTARLEHRSNIFGSKWLEPWKFTLVNTPIMLKIDLTNFFILKKTFVKSHSMEVLLSGFYRKNSVK